jgi:hypothetical protein
MRKHIPVRHRDSRGQQTLGAELGDERVARHATLLIAAIFPALLAEAQHVILKEAGLAAAIAAVLVLLKR